MGWRARGGRHNCARGSPHPFARPSPWSRWHTEPEPAFDVEVAQPLDLDAFAAVGRPDTPDAPDPARLEPDPDRIPRRPERARAPSDDVPSPSHEPSAAHLRDQTDDFARQPTPAAASEAVVTVLDPPHPNASSFSPRRRLPRPVPEPVPGGVVDRPVSTTHKYKHRASIGHDARVMEERGMRVQARVGRPKVKSIFHAMAGVRPFRRRRL